ATAGICAFAGCAKTRESGSASSSAMTRTEEPAEAGETKVKLEQTPPLVRKTIERELQGADLEDIAMKQQHGKTVYETDIIKGGHKWEVLVADDGSILHKFQEGSAEEKAADEAESRQEATEAGWREN